MACATNALHQAGRLVVGKAVDLTDKLSLLLLNFGDLVELNHGRVVHLLALIHNLSLSHNTKWPSRHNTRGIRHRHPPKPSARLCQAALSDHKWRSHRCTTQTELKAKSAALCQHQ
eukprot:TRINITY_DN10487_c0_g3_i1.p2 TRINITY_DN10487_c0_g3~~TRINITY_DN10487_c0_g3_i1.p2  ORF type:complete len:116 (-),score=5.97 TRINITY_DN10487_c0_g3_i1:176-523(-)